MLKSLIIGLLISVSTVSNNNYSFKLGKVDGYVYKDYIEYIDWRKDMIKEYGIEEYINMNKELGIDNEYESFIDYQEYIK